MTDGIYTMTFRGKADWGMGMLVFRQGIIAGADSGGVVYDGTYSNDGTNLLVQAKMTVPPGASATNDGQSRLLAMGVRTALDTVMIRIVGDRGSFVKKLAEMTKEGHLSSKQKEMLETVIDAGSASAHRGYKPNRDLLEEMVATMESIIRDHYLTGPILRHMRTLLPPRP